MKVLLMGAFGNIGFSTFQELLRQSHTVCCFEQKNRRTEKKARQVEGKVEVIWGKVLLVGGGSACQVLYRDYLG